MTVADLGVPTAHEHDFDNGCGDRPAGNTGERRGDEDSDDDDE